MNKEVFQVGGINSLVVYGPLSHALSSFLETVPAAVPMIRIYGKSPPPPRAATWDIDNVADLPERLNQLQSRLPNPRIAFIGAGFISQSRLLIQETAESVERQLEANIVNYVRVTSLLLPLMVRSNFGRFVYLSSFRAQIGNRGISIYSASKAFGEAFFRSVGIEYGSLGITSLSIRMGYFTGGLLSEASEESLESLRRQTGIGRLGTPLDVCQAIEFALGSQFTNSGVIDLNGGLFFS